MEAEKVIDYYQVRIIEMQPLDLEDILFPELLSVEKLKDLENLK